MEPTRQDANSKKQGPGPTTLMEKMPRKPNVLALPQIRIGNPQKVQRGNRSPNTAETKPESPEKALKTNTDP